MKILINLSVFAAIVGLLCPIPALAIDASENVTPSLGPAVQGKGDDGKTHFVHVDNSGNVNVLSGSCSSFHQFMGTVGTTAITYTSQVPGRKFVEICNAVENTTNPFLKVYMDADPVIGVGGVGYGLLPGGCKTFPVDSTHVLHLVGSTAGVGYEGFEC